SPDPRLSAAAGPRGGVNHRQTLRPWRLRLDGLDDRSVHAVGDPMREFDRELLEAGRLEPGLVLALRERAGDASDVRAALRPLLRCEPVLGDHVADPDP